MRGGVQVRPMPESTHEHRDREIIKVLRAQGADLSKPRHTLFYFYFPSREDAETAHAALLQSPLSRERAFRVEVAPAASGPKWLCRAEAEMVIDQSVIDRLRPQLEQIARQANGEYDGWECAAVP